MMVGSLFALISFSFPRTDCGHHKIHRVRFITFYNILMVTGTKAKSNLKPKNLPKNSQIKKHKI